MTVRAWRLRMWRPIWKFRPVNSGVNFCCWKSTAGVSSGSLLGWQGLCPSDHQEPRELQLLKRVGALRLGDVSQAGVAGGRHMAGEIVLQALARPGSSRWESREHPQSLAPWLCVAGAVAGSRFAGEGAAGHGVGAAGWARGARGRAAAPGAGCGRRHRLRGPGPGRALCTAWKIPQPGIKHCRRPREPC